MKREPVAVIRAAYVNLLLEELTARGKDRASLVRQFDLPRGLDAAPDAYVALRPVLALIRWGELQTGSGLGVQAASRLRVDHFSGEMRRALAETPALHKALHRFARLGPRELSFARYEISGDRECVAIRCGGSTGNSSVLFLEWLQIRSILAVIRHFAGESWQPAGISVRSAELGADQSETCVSFARSLLKLTTSRFSRRVPPAAPDCAAVAAPGRPVWDFPTALKSVLQPYFSHECPDLDLAGRITGVCGRTVQRQLNAFGLNYKDLIGEVRLDIAKRLLSQGGKKVIDVSYAAGYADPSHFARAFRRATGVSPKRYSSDLQLGRSDETLRASAGGN